MAEVRWPRAPSTPRPTLRPSLLAAGPCGRLSPVPSPGSTVGTGRLFSGQHRRMDRSPRRLAEARLGPSALARPPPGLGPALPARCPSPFLPPNVSSPSGTPGASPPRPMVTHVCPGHPARACHHVYLLTPGALRSLIPTPDTGWLPSLLPALTPIPGACVPRHSGSIFLPRSNLTPNPNLPVFVSFPRSQPRLPGPH